MEQMMAEQNGHHQMLKIVIGGARGDQIEAQISRWRQEYPNLEFTLAQGEADQVAAAPGADAWLGRISRAAFLAAGPQLRWVHSTGVGIETLAGIPELVESDVIVTNVRGGHSNNVAEHAFALLLALTRNVPMFVKNQQEHAYRKPTAGQPLTELSGGSMVVYGFGHIGRAVAKRALAFEMKVIGVDLKPDEAAKLLAIGNGAKGNGAGQGADGTPVAPLEKLDDVLPQADVVVITAPYTEASHRAFNAERIAKMRPGSYLVAVSRGGIVDEAALAEALRAGHLAGAALDVQEQEPLAPDSPLWDVPNLLISPHVASSSRKTTARVWSITSDNVRRFVNGLPLENVCDLRAGF
jgi:phosphoglycerate dehydrogenase-like enzyme